MKTLNSGFRTSAIILSGFFFALSFPQAVFSQDRDGNAIVAEMDRRMNFIECRMVIRIEDTKSGTKARTLKARVEYLKDVGTRMEFEEPARDRGKRILFSGSSMWMATPSVSKPVRLSGKDAFMGTSFTNDDVMNLDKADDYESTITASDETGWDLVMTAKLPSLPYPKIILRVGRDYLPIGMEYFTRSGQASRQVRFSEAKGFGGKLRPSVMVITDLMNPDESSSVIFEEIREETFSRSRFTPASLGK